MKPALIAAVILGAFALASYAVLGVVGSRAEARDQRRDFCVDLEAVKAAQREKAIENFNRLDQNLKILNVKKTARVVRIAKANRDADLKRFKARECP